MAFLLLLCPLLLAVEPMEPELQQYYDNLSPEAQIKFNQLNFERRREAMEMSRVPDKDPLNARDEQDEREETLPSDHNAATHRQFEYHLNDLERAERNE